MSRIDGLSSLQTICLLTGLGEDTTLEVLEGLHDRGLIELGEDEDPGRPPTPSGGSPLQPMDTLVDPTPPPGMDAKAETTGAAPARDDDASWQDSDTAEEVDLKPELRKRIRELHEQMGDLNLFELFGVGTDSDIKTIRKAFFALSKIYHPDRYFGKKLGPYAEMLHVVFKQMNAGYKMLCEKTKLEEYRRMVVGQAEQERLVRQVEQQAAAALEEERHATGEIPVDLDLEAPAPLDAPAGTYSYKKGNKPSPKPAPPKRARTGGAFRAHRKKALMDLVGHKRPPDRKPLVTPPDVRAISNDDLQRRERRQTDHKARAQRVTGRLFSRAKKAQQFFAQGKAQLDRGQFLAATASLRLAMTYNPEEAEYSEAYENASAKAKELTAENYFKRGMMEESVGRFDAAALSFVKAADHLPKGIYLVKAAEALLWAHDSEDLIKAKDYATRAVQTDPNSVDIRITAAKVYRSAGMKRNARRELQQALKIEPGNSEAKELLKGV